MTKMHPWKVSTILGVVRHGSSYPINDHSLGLPFSLGKSSIDAFQRYQQSKNHSIWLLKTRKKLSLYFLNYSWSHFITQTIQRNFGDFKKFVYTCEMLVTTNLRYLPHIYRFLGYYFHAKNLIHWPTPTGGLDNQRNLQPNWTRGDKREPFLLHYKLCKTIIICNINTVSRANSIPVNWYGKFQIFELNLYMYFP